MGKVFTFFVNSVVVVFFSMGDDEEYEYDYGSDQDSHYDYGSDQGDIDNGEGEEAGSSSGGGNLNDQWIEIENSFYGKCINNELI